MPHREALGSLESGTDKRVTSAAAVQEVRELEAPGGH